jgi:nicotinate-nucleotide adenylyltransferase
LKELAGLDEVWLMVSPQNPLKQGSSDLLDDKLRYQLTQLALDGEEGIKASDYELHLPKPSYTWNTLEHLKADYPDYTFVLLIGGDNWQLFPRWYHAEDILANYQIVVYPRRGSEIDCDHLPDNVTVVNTKLLDISSTEIRQRIRAGKGIKRLVPKVVADYILSHHLYV